jgi:hypothetical protein
VLELGTSGVRLSYGDIGRMKGKGDRNQGTCQKRMYVFYHDDKHTCFILIPRSLVKTIQREPSLAWNSEMIHGKCLKNLLSFRISRGGFSGRRSDPGETVVSEED